MPLVIETGGSSVSCLLRLALALLRAGACRVVLSFADGTARRLAVFR